MSSIQAVRESEGDFEFPALQPVEEYVRLRQRIAELEKEIAQSKTCEWDDESRTYTEGLEAELLEEKARLLQFRSSLDQQFRSNREGLGRIEVIYGCMFGGKTNETILRVREARYNLKEVQVFKHALDTRYDSWRIVAHKKPDEEGLSESAVPVNRASDILDHLAPDTEVVAIDEAQFFSSSESPSLVTICEHLADINIRVIIGGLNLDFRGEPFGLMPQLMAIADLTIQKTTECKICGKPATRTQRLIDGLPAPYDDPVVLVGAEVYQPRCRNCHQVQNKPVASLVK